MTDETTESVDTPPAGATESEAKRPVMPPGVVPDEDLTHRDGCVVLTGADPADCGCGSYASQQMIRLQYFLTSVGVFS